VCLCVLWFIFLAQIAGFASAATDVTAATCFHVPLGCSSFFLFLFLLLLRKAAVQRCSFFSFSLEAGRLPFQARQKANPPLRMERWCWKQRIKARI
jgi:hypothetical protein